MNNSKIAIVLGGTNGLGAAMAGQLSGQGYTVKTIGRSRHADYVCDLGDLSEATRLAETIYQNAPRIDLFVWAAAVFERGYFAEQSLKTMLYENDVNFGNALPVVQAVWRRQIARPEASFFVTISSTAASNPHADAALYDASKASQAQFTRCLGLEAADKDWPVNVRLFRPGGMLTELWRNEIDMDKTSFMDPEKVSQHILDATWSADSKFYEEVIEKSDHPELQ